MRRMYSENQIKKVVEQGDLNINGSITGDEIVEKMSGYSFGDKAPTGNATLNITYAGVVKNGNKITFAVAFNLTKTQAEGFTTQVLGRFKIPEDIWNNLYLYSDSFKNLSVSNIDMRTSFYGSISSTLAWDKQEDNNGKYVRVLIVPPANMSTDTPYYGRAEITFLLGKNLAN